MESRERGNEFNFLIVFSIPKYNDLNYYQLRDKKYPELEEIILFLSAFLWLKEKK